MKPEPENAQTRPDPSTAPTASGIDLDESVLSADDVAKLASAVASGQLPRPTIRRLAAANRADPRFAGHYQALTALARDAGFDPVRDQDLETALECHRDFLRLLDTDGWEHPSEVLDPDGDLGISYRELAHIAAARADRAEGESRPAAVREKLLKAWAEQRQRAAPVVSFVAQLLEHDRKTAEAMLQQASIEYRRQRRPRP